jgi:hypothetical protein
MRFLQVADLPGMGSSARTTRTVWVDWGAGPATPLSRLEMRLGAFATSLWAIIACVADTGAFVAIGNKPAVVPAARLITLGLIAASIALQVKFVALAWGSLRRQQGESFGPALVFTQRSLPWIARPVLALLWLLQFVLGCVYVLVVEGFINAPDSQVPPHLWFMRALIVFVCAYATYVYLLLAVGTMVRSPRVVNAIWRMRFAVDALASIIVLLHLGR